jgi:alpha-L-fucosidase 2
VNENIIFFDKPADCWMEGLPLGNGQIGAMVMGYPFRERICFNHEDIWRKIDDRKTIPVFQHLAQIRKKLLDGDWEKGGKLLLDKLQPSLSKACAMAEYQPACDLALCLDSCFPAENYIRSLDLSKGIAEVSYSEGKIKHTRSCFVSAPDNVFVMRLQADRKKAISGSILLEREASPDCKIHSHVKNNILYWDAKLCKGPFFNARVEIICKNGAVSIAPENDKIIFSHADEVFILIYISVGKNIKNNSHPAGKRNYKKMLKRHVDDHEKIYNRVFFSLNSSRKEKKQTTDCLLHSAFAGFQGKHLYELMFKMGRYLMIAGSRPGSKAMHLQGIWNNQLHPPWQSDYHLDMNLQMNYWLAESTNLSEFAFPLFDLVQTFMHDGEINASHFYGCRGVLFPIACAGESKMLPGPWVAWTGSAGWLAQHFWRHYEYNLDRDFLEATAYPYMKKVAEFYEDFLIKDHEGRYMAIPSLSPENTPAERGEWQPHKTICINSTMDIAIIRELMGNLIEASSLLGLDLEKRKKWQEISDNLPEWPIDKNGILKEWSSETNMDNHNHRHFSHLYPLFPGNMFTEEDSPELFKAAAKALYAREANGYADNAGWSYPYMALFHARLGDGNKALQCLNYLARSCMMDNLLTIHNDWRHQGYTLYWKLGDRAFMIDAILGAAAAISEMLLQSANGLIKILPALPESWDRGKIDGLKACGNFEIDIKWDKGYIKKISIKSFSGQQCCVKFCRPHKKFILTCGRSIIKTVEKSETYVSFETEKNKIYRFNEK